MGWNSQRGLFHNIELNWALKERKIWARIWLEECSRPLCDSLPKPLSVDASRHVEIEHVRRTMKRVAFREKHSSWRSMDNVVKYYPVEKRPQDALVRHETEGRMLVPISCIGTFWGSAMVQMHSEKQRWIISFHVLLPNRIRIVIISFY